MKDLRPETADNTPPYLRGAVYGVAAVSIWAGWMAITRLGVTTNLDSWDIAALRFGVAGLLLSPVMMRHGFALDQLGLARLLLLISGAGAPYAIIAASGLKFAPAADAGALVPGVMPLFVALLASFFLAEKFSPNRKLGLLMILTGVIAIAGSSLMSAELNRSFGHAIFLCASFLWAVFTIILKWAKLSPLHATALVSVGSMIGYLPVYFTIAGTKLLDAPLSDLIIQSIYQGVFTTVVSLFLFGKAVSILGASSGAAFGALVPAMAALLAIPILGEFPKPVDWLGIITISIGVFLASGGPLPQITNLKKSKS